MFIQFIVFPLLIHMAIEGTRGEREEGGKDGQEGKRNGGGGGEKQAKSTA